MSEDQQCAWIPVGTAVMRLRKQYDDTDLYANDEVCFRAATETILRRLRSGQLSSKAAGYSCFDGTPDFDDPPSPPQADKSGLFVIPAQFWSAFHSCKEFSRESDWIAGDFEYREDADYFQSWGQVIGLVVREAQVPSFYHREPSEVLAPKYDSGDVNSGGRSAAKWWPEFAEELAVYIHEEGLPPGHGHEGQSAVIDAIFKRLAAAGKTEPGRATVQPVVNAVLDRIRSAGN